MQLMQHPCKAHLHYYVDMAENKKNTLSRRLKHVLEVMDWTETELARAIGAGHQSTVQHWIVGRNKRMQSRFAWPLQDKYGWNARWVLDGEGPERIPAPDPEKDQIIEELSRLSIERLRAIRSIIIP